MTKLIILESSEKARHIQEFCQELKIGAIALASIDFDSHYYANIQLNVFLGQLVVYNYSWELLAAFDWLKDVFFMQKSAHLSRLF